MTKRAVLFDMDGVLIDSEPLWKKAGMDIFNEYGIPATYEDMLALTGVPAPTIAKKIYEKYHPASIPAEEMGKKLNDRAISMILENKPLINGVVETLESLKSQGYELAVASASPRYLLEGITKSCGIDQYFSYLSSAAELPYSKPHPAVWLNAAEKLGIVPQNCIGIEDSIVGMISVKAAFMKCIAIPGVLGSDDPRWSVADIKLKSLLEITPEVLKQLSN